MKPVRDLLSKKYIKKSNVYTIEAFAYLKDIGKNPYIYDVNKIRVSHRGKYFDYSPTTGKWCYTRTSGIHKWWNSYSIEDFLSQIDSFMGWYTQKQIEQ